MGKKLGSEIMKNNKGFMSVAIIYSFFLVFLTLILSIVTNYVSTRTLLNSIKKNVKIEIADTNFARYLINHLNEVGLSEIAESYRYVGQVENNYVCLNSQDSICPDEDLYRIIGVINGKIKVIKATPIEAKMYDADNSNVLVNTSIYKYLNEEFINTIKNYANNLERTIWYVGGIDEKFKTENGLNIYNAEVGENKNTGVTVDAYITLPLVSDYALASSNYNNISKDYNWLFNDDMWLLTRCSNYYNYAFYINDEGRIDIDNVLDEKNIYPCFYLKRSVQSINANADGTKDNPYILGGFNEIK